MKKSSVVAVTAHTWRILLVVLLAFGQVVLLRPAQRAAAAPIEKPLWASAPAVNVSVPAQAFIGSSISATVTFDNTDPVDTGYGPIIDLEIPTRGADGAPNPDGLGFVSATYLVASIENTAIPVPVGGCVAHPYMMDGTTQAPIQVCGLTEGNTFVALRLPFCSFTP